MAVEVLVNMTPNETRVAVVENGMLQEIHLERANNRGLVGNVYVGKVIRVLPGMQAAFVDIGLEKAAFLHANDIYAKPKYDEQGELKPVQDIGYLVRQGQYIMVQVLKDPLGTKGARLTTEISIASRYIVLLPQENHLGVSQRIDCEEERERLKSIVSAQTTGDLGFIVRTAAEHAVEEELAQDIIFLKRLWDNIKQQKKNKSRGGILYEELGLAARVLRDMAGVVVDRVRIDSKMTYSYLSQFATEFIPELKDKLEMYDGDRPIFDLFDVENEIQRALDRHVPLKSGGGLVIDQTEAMTTIDINTGAFVGHRNQEDTIFNTNIEATQAIARQLRLRNLGGIIIVDFIDMQNPEHKRRVLQSLEAALSKDRVRTTMSDFTSLGLVEMTRKRTRESLEHLVSSECPVCQGRGSLKTVETVCYEIMREIVRVNKAYVTERFIVYASPLVAERLLDEETHALAELELFVGKEVQVKAESLYHQEQFDVVMM